MPKMNIELKLSGLEPLKKLIELLSIHYTELPTDVQNELTAMMAEERLVWDMDYLAHIGVPPHDVDVFADGERVERVAAVYPEELEMLVMGRGFVKFSSVTIIRKSTGVKICEAGDKK